MHVTNFGRLAAGIICAGLIGQTTVGIAQEVRRALPATPTPGETAAPRALPVNPTPTPVLRARPVNPTPAPVTGQSILDERIDSRGSETQNNSANSRGSSAEPDNRTRDQIANDEIRLAPEGNTENAEDPAKAQLAIADGLYVRKLYDLAAPEYEKFLGRYQDDSGRAAAMYRLADCYSKTGQESPAVNTYRMLLTEIQTGEFVGSAAFRLASRAFDQKDYGSASSLYEKAYNNSKSSEVKITALYYEAKSLELMNRKSEARPIYEEVAKTGENNPFRDAARLSVAYFALENGQKESAYDLFRSLGADAVKPAVRVESLVRAGILGEDLKKRDEAEQLFKTAISTSAEGKWKQIAQLELMKLEYDGDKFAQVLDTYAKNLNALGEETKPSVLLIVANSYRQLGKQSKALDFYNLLIRQYPSTQEAADGRYQRLVSLDQLKDPSLSHEVDAYLLMNPPKERADKALLLKAQALLQQNQYAIAAKLYLQLTNSTLPDTYKPDCYYAAGYGFSQVHNNSPAIEAFSGLIQNYPQYKLVVKALLKRALLYQEGKNYTAALTDFSKIIEQYPTAAECETALLEKGLTLGQQGEYQQMTDTFHQLLQKFPNSSGAAQANFWIGWADFEAKHYAEAIGPLSAARQKNPGEYGDRVTLRLIFCQQTLGHLDDAATEVSNFVQSDIKRVSLVADACAWLGQRYFEAKQYEKSEKFLSLLTKNVSADKFDKGVWLTLGHNQIELQHYPEATASINSYLQSATDAADRAKAFVALSAAQLGAKQYDDATKSAEQAMTLQPEGRTNAEARLAVGDVESGRGNYENAAKSYLSVAVLYEDPEVTPLALEKAYMAFHQSGNETEANKTLTELRTRFPNYQLKTANAG
ncbi:MAG: tetratricopeptide repeat protein [Chthoniobacterales bacterium]